MRLSVDEAIRTLVPIVQDRKLVIFVGSGISVDAGLPNWNQLMTGYIEFCHELQETLQPEDRFDALVDDAQRQIDKHPARVASVLRAHLIELQKKKSSNIYRAFQNWFTGKMQSTTGPTENHCLIVGTDYPQILTSNYDMLLEDAARVQGYKRLWLLNSFTYKDEQKVASSLYQRHPSIIHLHGDVLNISLDDIVFTAEDYVEIERQYTGFTMALQSLFLMYSVLFVGYGGSDPHFEDFIQEMSFAFNWAVNTDLPRTFMVLNRDKVGEVLEKYKNRLRTDIIVQDDYSQTTQLLRALKAAMPRPIDP